MKFFGSSSKSFLKIVATLRFSSITTECSVEARVVDDASEYSDGAFSATSSISLGNK
jgi:hypothetical protein